MAIQLYCVLVIVHTMLPAVYYGHCGTNKECPDYQFVMIFQVSLYDKACIIGTITECVDYTDVLAD